MFTSNIIIFTGQKYGDMTVNVTQSARTRAEAAQLARENAALRETVLALHSELFGARYYIYRVLIIFS